MPITGIHRTSQLLNINSSAPIPDIAATSLLDYDIGHVDIREHDLKTTYAGFIDIDSIVNGTGSHFVLISGLRFNILFISSKFITQTKYPILPYVSMRKWYDRHFNRIAGRSPLAHPWGDSYLNIIRDHRDNYIMLPRNYTDGHYISMYQYRITRSSVQKLNKQIDVYRNRMIIGKSLDFSIL